MTQKTKWHIAILNTSTDEKLYQYREAARAKGWPILFYNIREIDPNVHTAEEDAFDYVGNIGGKMGVGRDVLNNHKDTIENNIARICQQNGIPTIPKERVLMLCDDSGLNVDTDVWYHLRQKLKNGAGYTPYDIIKGIKKGSPGPGTESGPIATSTMGWQNLMSMVDEAAHQVGHKHNKYAPDAKPYFDKDGRALRPVVVHDHVLLNAKAVNEPPETPGITLQANNTLFFRTPTDPKSPVMTSMHYMVVPPDGRTDQANMEAIAHSPSCFDMGKKYITEKCGRAQLVDKLAHTLGLGTKDKLTPEQWPQFTPSPDFRVGFLPDNGSKPADWRSKIERNHLRLHVTNGKPEQPQDSYEALTPFSHVVNNADGIILYSDTPPDVSGEAAKLANLEKNYTLMSLLVAKQLEYHMQVKPLIVIDHNGSEKEAIALHDHLANCGMAKDYVPFCAKDYSGKGVEHRSNSYFHVVSGSDLDKLMDTATRILEDHSRTYDRKPVYESRVFERGEKLSDNTYKVAVFLSAQSDNGQMKHACEKLSKHLVDRNMGLVYGGGDRHSMGFLVDAFREHYQKKHPGSQNIDVEAYSTEPILTSESKHQRFPQNVRYQKLNKDIYERMADMIERSDTIVIEPGGDGTAQEWLAILMLKKYRPELMEGKKIVIHNMQHWHHSQERFWNPMLTMILGEEDAKLLTKPRDQLTGEEKAQRAEREEKLGMYVEDSIQGVTARLDEFSNYHQHAILKGMHSKNGKPIAALH